MTASVTVSPRYLGPHAPYSCDEAYMLEAAETAEKYGLPVSIHLSESKNEVENAINQYGCTPIAMADRCGLLTDKTFAAHCVYATDEDIALMAERGVSVVTNPISNLKLANGVAPIGKFVKAGINVCLGTDGASSNNALNMFRDLYPLTAAMKQQVRELTLVVKPTGDAAGRITEIVAHLTGAAGTLDFATDTYGAASNVVLPFTKITEGDDAGKWKATVRLLGVTGTEQLLTGEIRYADGNPTPTTLKSDLTEALKEFNTGKGESLTLGGTLVETPEGMEVDGAEINGWEEVKGDDVNADL